MSDHGWGWGWHSSSEAPWAPWQIKAWQNAGGLADEAHGTPGRHQWWDAPREEPSGPAGAAEPSASAEPPCIHRLPEWPEGGPLEKCAERLRALRVAEPSGRQHLPQQLAAEASERVQAADSAESAVREPSAATEHMGAQPLPQRPAAQASERLQAADSLEPAVAEPSAATEHPGPQHLLQRPAAEGPSEPSEFAEVPPTAESSELSEQELAEAAERGYFTSMGNRLAALEENANDAHKRAEDAARDLQLMVGRVVALEEKVAELEQRAQIAVANAAWGAESQIAVAEAGREQLSANGWFCTPGEKVIENGNGLIMLDVHKRCGLGVGSGDALCHNPIGMIKIQDHGWCFAVCCSDCHRWQMLAAATEQAGLERLVGVSGWWKSKGRNWYCDRCKRQFGGGW